MHFSENYLEITMGKHTNRFYCFGGKDASSASLIQGMTLSGVLFDEVALMPRSCRASLGKMFGGGVKILVQL